MPDATLSIGDVEIVAISDVDTTMPLSDMFDRGDPPPGGAETLGERFPDDFTADAWRFRARCFVVRSPAGIALIDTGVGPAGSTFGRWLGIAGTLPEELDAIGIGAPDVSHVILTHAHSDHIGWNSARTEGGFAPRFPNARYHLHEADVVWSRSFDDEENAREFAETLEPLLASGQLDTSPDDREVLPGLTLRHAPGHTPGHRVVLLEAGGERVLFVGDLLHFTFQLNDVDFRSPPDESFEEGSRTRGAWLDSAEAEGMTLATAHLPPGPFARLERSGGERVLRARVV